MKFTRTDGKKHHHFSNIILPLRNNPDDFVKNYITESDYKSISEIQGRILLKPDKITNPNLVEIIDYWRHPLNEKALKKYKNELTSLIKNELSNWLQKCLEVPKDTFYTGIPSLQKLHTYVVQGEVDHAHNLLQATPSLLPDFIAVGNLSMVKDIVQRYPDIDLIKPIPVVNNYPMGSSYQMMSLPIVLAYNEKKYALVDYLFEQTYLKKDLSQVYLQILLGIAICYDGSKLYNLLIEQHPDIEFVKPYKIGSSDRSIRLCVPLEIRNVIRALAKIDDVKKRQSVAQAAAPIITKIEYYDIENIILVLAKVKDPETLVQTVNLFNQDPAEYSEYSCHIITYLASIKDAKKRQSIAQDVSQIKDIDGYEIANNIFALGHGLPLARAREITFDDVLDSVLS